MSAEGSTMASEGLAGMWVTVRFAVAVCPDRSLTATSTVFTPTATTTRSSAADTRDTGTRSTGSSVAVASQAGAAFCLDCGLLLADGAVRSTGSGRPIRGPLLPFHLAPKGSRRDERG